MEPRTQHRSSRSQAAQTWWGSLRSPPPEHPSRPLAGTLALAAVPAAVAMPLVWHHLTVPATNVGGPSTVEVFNGVSAASWLIAVAATALALAFHLYRHSPGDGVRVTMTLLAFLTVNGMFIDYFDWSTRGASLQVPAFYGPGFFAGLCSAALLVSAAVLGWRLRGSRA